MTVITCGRTSMNDRVEELFESMRRQQGYPPERSCGRAIDLDNELQQIQLYRCVECGRFLCKPCIAGHFEESRHDTTQGEAP